MSALSKPKLKYKYSVSKTGHASAQRAHARTGVLLDRHRLADLRAAKVLIIPTKIDSKIPGVAVKDPKGVMSFIHEVYKYTESIGHFLMAGFDFIGAIAQCFGAA